MCLSPIYTESKAWEVLGFNEYQRALQKRKKGLLFLKKHSLFHLHGIAFSVEEVVET